VSRAVVIGGGVIGVACAYSLRQRGWDVTLVDRGRIGGGCSHGNCGFVSPSHVLPLAAPGAVRYALASMLKKHSPFHIKPRLDLHLWKWLFRFARRCNTSDMLAAGHACHALLESSRNLYQDLIAREALNCEWQTEGLLFVYDTRGGFDAYARTDDILAEHYNLPAKRYEGEALTDLEPALRPGLAGAFFYEDDAHLRPDRLMAEWRRVLDERGVEIIENCEFQGFVDSAVHSVGNGLRAVPLGSVGNGLRAVPLGETTSQRRMPAPERHSGRSLRTGALRASSAITSHGELPADAFVIATGSWTPLLADHVGYRLPIQPGKGYSMTMPRPAICPRIPMLLMEHRVGVTPMKTGYRLGSTMEFAGYDTSLPPERLELLRRGAAACLRDPYCEPVEEAWYGWRPMTFDSVPVIDRSPKYDNLYLAAGHNMLGLSMAPATGKLVAELMAGETPHVDPTPYSVSRFGVR
jgi:D-amino-acid dehydrogenase